MAREQLYIGNEYIPLSKSINASITKSIADIAEPEKRKATYSKTTSIPNSPEAQQVFGSIFELNLTDGSFNPTVKVDLLYLVDGEPIMRGYCQLKSITQLNNNDITYNIVMFGTIANIFREMGEDYLDALAEFDIYGEPGTPDTENSLSRWNHPFDKTVQEDSWETQVYDNSVPGFIPFALGQGYVYPLIDFGLTSNLDDWQFDQMAMSIYAREYMNAIVRKAGFTWTSTFLDSTYFKSLIIPSSPANYQLDNSEIADREFKADTSIFVDTASATSANLNTGGGFVSLGVVRFTNEITDAGNNYDPATGVFTCVHAGVYNINAVIGMTATFTPLSGGLVVCTSDIEGRIELFVNGLVQQSLPFYITYDDYPLSSSIGARTTLLNPTAGTSGTNSVNPEYITNAGSFHNVSNPAAAINSPRQAGPPNKYLSSFQNINLIAGGTIDVRIKARYRGLDGLSGQMFYNGSIYSGGNATLNLTTASTFANKVVNTYPAYGSFLKVEKAIPKKIKQKDFFMSIVKMFNLWIDIDPLNQQNLLIEPREDFLTTDVIDISTKIAQDKKLEIIPMGKLDAVDFLFTYKSDKDYYNAKYESQWTEIYGQRTVQTTNDFVRGSKKTELIFSPTPSVAPPLSDRVLPTIIEVDDQGQPKDTSYNIRILYYGGLKATFNTWNLIHFPAFNIPLAETFSTYPYAGHFDDPFSALEDINFGIVSEVYYDDDLQPIQITNNNLFNKYHIDMLNAYTDPDSKIVTAWCNMNPTDFKIWDFTKLYFFENAYFRLNKIMNYNPTGEELTKCEFLYLTDVLKFTPDRPIIFGGDGPLLPDTNGGAIDSGETEPIKGTKNSSQPNGGNYTGKQQDVNGDYNYIASDSYRIEIYGDNNRVFSEAEDINIQGDNNTIDAGIKNVTLINTSGLTIEESDVTYINGVKVDAFTDHQSGYYKIEAADTVTVEENKQMTNWNRLEIDGTLIIDGQLILK